MKVQPGDTLVALAVLGPSEDAAPNGDGVAAEVDTGEEGAEAAAGEADREIDSSGDVLAHLDGAAGYESPLTGRGN
jgi:hypothetical protein